MTVKRSRTWVFNPLAWYNTSSKSLSRVTAGSVINHPQLGGRRQLPQSATEGEVTLGLGEPGSPQVTLTGLLGGGPPAGAGGDGGGGGGDGGHDGHLPPDWSCAPLWVRCFTPNQVAGF